MPLEAMAATIAVSVAGWFAAPLISKALDRYRILKQKEEKELEEGLEKEIELEERDTELPSKKKVSFLPSIFPSSEKSKDGAPSSSCLSVAKDIKRIRERLDEILKQGIDFGLTDMVRSAPQIDPELFMRRETSSYLQDDESTFVGRDDVKEEIYHI